jgi:probable O-glycosylation ligase (exosortase A-associated)
MIGPRDILKIIGVVVYNEWVMTLLIIVIIFFALVYGYRKPVILIALYFALSIINPQSFLPFFMSIPLIKIVTFLALLSIMMNGQERYFRIPLIFSIFSIFLLFSFISYVNAIEETLAAKRFWEFNKIFFVSVLTVAVLKDRQAYDFLTQGVLLSFYFLILKTLTETQTKGRWFAVNGTGGWIGDSNDWGLAIAMILPFVYIQLVNAKGLKWQIFHILTTISTLLVLTFTSSRGAFLAAASACLVLLVTERKKIRAVAGGVVVLLVVLVYMPGSYFDQIKTIFAGADKFEAAWEGDHDFDEYTGAERAWNWNLARRMMNDYPWTGVGWGNYVIVKQQYDIHADDTVAHSTWFQVGAETGIYGLIAYVSTLCIALLSLFRSWMAAKKFNDEWLMSQTRALAAGMVAFCVGGTFVSREYSDLLFCFLCLTCALSFFRTQLYYNQQVGHANA